jgi:ABC-type multidrug transport system fused ATPase/permease subunit
MSSNPSDVEALASLGTGGSDDRLSFKLVLQLFRRSTTLLRPVRKHLAFLFLGFSLTAGVGAIVGAPLGIAFSNSVLVGEPPTELEASLLRLGPEFVAAETLSPELRMDVAYRLLVVGGLMIAVITPAMLLLYYYLVWILQRVNQVLRVRMLEQLQRLSLRFHSGSRVGDAIYRMVQDSSMVTKLIEVLFIQPLLAFGRHVFGLAFVALIDWRLAVAILSCWPFYLALGHFTSRKMRVGFRRARETTSDVTSRIQENLSAIKVIKAYGAEDAMAEHFEKDSRVAFDAAFEARYRFAIFNVTVFWITGIVFALAGGYAASQAAGEAPLPAVLAITGYVAWNFGVFNLFKERFSDGVGALRSVFRTWANAQNVAIGLDRVYELLDLEPEVQDAAGAVPLEGVVSGVRFEDLRFRYQADRPALDGVSFEAKVGEVTALVGATGSGKTTLVSLLLRLYDPNSGSVQIDGQDLRSFTVASVRDSVAIALQENWLSGATIRENIRYARPSASDEEVQEAARVAAADEFIEALPNRYDTMLGERGAKLSTGQRQRISIARAVLKNTPILILDEPTASLDAATEARVLENLARWGENRLIFLITHRLGTVRNADNIVVLEEGRVRESGSHAALMDRHSAYRRLVDHEVGGTAAVAAGAAS